MEEMELHLGGHWSELDLCVLPLMIVKLHCPISELLLLVLLLLWNLRNCKNYCDCFAVALASDIAGGNEVVKK